MFGEYDSESPRVPSPWDPFLPSPPSEGELCIPFRRGIPKLVPEAEEVSPSQFPILVSHLIDSFGQGNVEYKLKLSHLNPARFARLVTQLKWRLLEGGGQAYYELGVADSGALIGLSRGDLEHSLETLEMMAGEIGASVIVVKEIEVPPLMVAIADKLSGYIDPETGQWAEKMYSRRSRVFLSSDGEHDTTPTTTEAETDFEDGPFTSTLATPADSSCVSLSSPTLTVPQQYFTTRPQMPSYQASPSILPIDDDLALFSMEPEPPLQDVEERLDATLVADSGEISVGIEIAAVYKPRPIRRRLQLTPSGPPPHHGKRSQKAKEKKSLPWRTIPAPDSSVIPEESKDENNSLDKQVAKVLHRRATRDKRRDERRATLLTSVAQVSIGVVKGAVEEHSVHHESPLPKTETSRKVVDVLETYVQQDSDGLGSILGALRIAEESSKSSSVQTKDAVLVANKESIRVDTPGTSPLTSTIADSQAPIAREPRLIVEALVVRKMSLEEAFLDFGGFSLN